MKNKALIIAVLLSVLNLSVFAAVDCDDPKNRPRFIGGVMISAGKKECDVARGSAARAKEDLELTIGRNPVTGKVTSKAELAGGDKATNNLEAAQQNFGKAKTELEEAEELYKSNPSTKYSNRLDKARKAFKQAQLDLEAAEEIKEKADRKKDK